MSERERWEEEQEKKDRQATRTMLAAFALTGIRASAEGYNLLPKDAAQAAVEDADALLAELEKGA